MNAFFNRKFSWVAIKSDGSLIGGSVDLLADCEKAAKKYEPLQYFVAGPTPMDWPKYSLPSVDPDQFIHERSQCQSLFMKLVKEIDKILTGES